MRLSVGSHKAYIVGDNGRWNLPIIELFNRSRIAFEKTHVDGLVVQGGQERQ
jgi:hypothetical protein